MNETEIIQNIFDVVHSAISEEYESIYVSYKLNATEIDGDMIYSQELRFYSKNLEGNKSDLKNRKSDFSKVVRAYFKQLRNEMASKHKDNSKWSAAVLRYTKGGEVKMNYDYSEIIKECLN